MRKSCIRDERGGLAHQRVETGRWGRSHAERKEASSVRRTWGESGGVLSQAKAPRHSAEEPQPKRRKGCGLRDPDHECSGASVLIGVIRGEKMEPRMTRMGTDTPRAQVGQLRIDWSKRSRPAEPFSQRCSRKSLRRTTTFRKSTAKRAQ